MNDYWIIQMKIDFSLENQFLEASPIIYWVWLAVPTEG